MNRFYTELECPLGRVLAAVNAGGALTDVHFVDGKYVPALTSEWQRADGHPVLEQTARELAAYFAKQRTTFTIPLAPTGTPFQHSAWKALCDIPFGQTRSYGEQARALGNANPIAILIPCHRVIGSSGSLTGYASGLERKLALLQLEGVLL
jgi:methylated-DNA-[protein]-cysteine S-methyltransferase